MAKTYSSILVGVELKTIEIESVIGQGFSGLNILGLPTDITRDMRERVRSALESIGLTVPARRVVVNIGPSDVIKLSRTPLSQLDFAVAACIIRSLFSDRDDTAPLAEHESEFLFGELSLSGVIKPVQENLMFQLVALKQPTFSCLCIPMTKEFMSKRFERYSHLKEWLEDRKSIPVDLRTKKLPNDHFNSSLSKTAENLLEKKKHIKETIHCLLKNPKLCVSLLVAAAGGHHLLVAGEPGIGKSFSLKKLPSFLLALNNEQSLEVRLINAQADESNRPFRFPHHSSTSAALVGGSSLKPAEVTLAHHGVLFLDELAEFQRTSLEALREPLDSGVVSLSRSSGQIIYPAQFQLCATTNPCPCGYLFSRKKPCRCNPNEGRKYLQKISGPLLDRFCLQVWLDPQPEKLDAFSEYLVQEIKSLNIDLWIERFINVQQFFRNHQNIESIQQELNKISQNINMEEPIFFTKFSARGQEKLLRLVKTFAILFPTIYLNKNINFIEEIEGYRELGILFAKRGFI